MKYNFTQPILEINGSPVEEKGKPILFAEAITNFLLAPTQDEQSGQEKVRAYELAKKINDASGEIEISLDELELIKKAVARAVPLVCGQITKYLQSASAE